MDIFADIVYRLLPSDWTHNIYFVFGVVLLYAILSCLQSFIKDPRFGWLAKYDDPIQTLLGVLGVWKKKSYSLMVIEKDQTAGAGATGVEQLPEIIRDPTGADKAAGVKQ